MEKIINISPSSNTSNKNTKKKDDLQKKANINAIMEKYNLKVPKKSKINDNKTDFVIKPLYKGGSSREPLVPSLEGVSRESMVPSLEPSVPSLKPSVPSLKPSVPSLEPSVPFLEKTLPKQIEKKTISVQSIINKDKEIKEQIKDQTKNINYNYENEINNKGAQDRILKIPCAKEGAQDRILKIPCAKEVDKDRILKIPCAKEVDKGSANIVMPKAIINNNKIHPKDFMNSSNIFNLIPKINPTKQYSHLQNKSVPEIKKNININNPVNANINANINANANRNITLNKPANQNIFKKISINPKLSEDASQNYKGEIENNNNNINNINNNNNNVKNINNVNNNKIKTNDTNTLTQQNKQINQIKQIYTSPKNNLIYRQNQALQQNIEIIPPVISELELRRKTLQEQQYKELEKLKYKKEQIQKINNRKKEIDLIKSIDIEKQKLRIIQNKQNELNDIYNKQIKHPSETQTHKHIIYNVDAKKTKKNIEQYRDVINIPNTPSIQKNNIHIPIPIPKNIDSIKFDSTEIKLTDNTNTNTNNINKLLIKPNPETNPEANPEAIPEANNSSKIKNKSNEDKKILNININNASFNNISTQNKPEYKYYKKKDVPDLKWASKAELYDTNTFTEELNMCLNIQPLFSNKKIIKDKTSLEEKTKILKNTYNFKNIDNFKDNIKNIIYKILEYDKIKLE